MCLLVSTAHPCYPTQGISHTQVGRFVPGKLHYRNNEIISIAFRGYVNLAFICINFLLMMSKDCALLSWHSSLNLLYSSVKWLLVKCHILEQLFFSRTSAKEMFRNSQLFWGIAGEKYFMWFWVAIYMVSSWTKIFSSVVWGAEGDLPF